MYVFVEFMKYIDIHPRKKDSNEKGSQSQTKPNNKLSMIMMKRIFDLKYSFFANIIM